MQKIATNTGNFKLQNHVDDRGGVDEGEGIDVVGGGVVVRLCGWSLSHIFYLNLTCGSEPQRCQMEMAGRDV
ncbi:hypothetical protein L1987_41592 [Smallanthus sonchifolius]|uniref:Uncharacterized protein n=1 Tax=Smallanthus sonchifolius TaxID=185202 RepID=A0ACB9GWB0_9ASTR|nr:hypothetical protein L1987_41592 [Smallanthus sonchifolius]